MVMVLGLTVFVDLITAVAVGVIMAALAFVKKMADEQLASIGEATPRVTTQEERDLLDQAKGKITMFDFGGPLSFGAAADLGHHVSERVKDKSAVILDFVRVPFIDVSAARAVETIACDTKLAGKTLYVAGMSDEIKEVLSGLNADHCVPEDTYFEHRIDALRAAVKLVEEEEKVAFKSGSQAV